MIVIWYSIGFLVVLDCIDFVCALRYNMIIQISVKYDFQTSFAWIANLEFVKNRLAWIFSA